MRASAVVHAASSIPRDVVNAIIVAIATYYAVQLGVFSTRLWRKVRDLQQLRGE